MNIRYHLPKPTQVELAIYDISGRLVKNLVNGAREVGSRSVFWDGTDESGDRVHGGTHFCRLTQGESAATTKLILLR